MSPDNALQRAAWKGRDRSDRKVAFRGKTYFLQNYRESDYVIDPRFSGYAREQLERFCEILRGKIETVEIRGVD